MKKEWYLQQATDEKDPRPFWDSYVHDMCEVLETTDKTPFGKPVKGFEKNKKDRKLSHMECGTTKTRIWYVFI